MGIFKLHSDYKPSGDQPEAIKKLVKGLEKGHRYQTLLGVTGSGKTFTMANVISRFDRPVLIMAPNKSLAAQLYQEYKTFFRKTRSIISFRITTTTNRKRIYQHQTLT